MLKFNLDYNTKTRSMLIIIGDHKYMILRVAQRNKTGYNITYNGHKIGYDNRIFRALKTIEDHANVNHPESLILDGSITPNDWTLSMEGDSGVLRRYYGGRKYSISRETATGYAERYLTSIDSNRCVKNSVFTALKHCDDHAAQTPPIVDDGRDWIKVKTQR